MNNANPFFDRVSRTILQTPQALMLLVAVGTFVLGSNFARGSLLSRSDFPAFYNAGRILNQYGAEKLYDKELQRTLDREVVSRRGERNDLLFAYTPFFALLFRPLAVVPIEVAFFVWAMVSVALFCAGVFLAWKAVKLPKQYRIGALAVALSFLPFLSFNLLAGQTSCFGFFFLALAVFLERAGKNLLSGLALSMLLYKPTLLPLLVVMILVTERWRLFLGFCLGALILGLVSLLVVGMGGLSAYFEMLRHFSESKAAGKHPLWLDIDFYSAALMLTHDYAKWAVLALAAVALPLLVHAWRQQPSQAWGLATVWTLVLSPYVLIYDATLMVFAVILNLSQRSRIPVVLSLLIWVLYLTPWVTRQTARTYGFSALTFVLILYGGYELLAAIRNRSGEPPARGIPAKSASVPE